jgi:hypothetical protein
VLLILDSSYSIAYFNAAADVQVGAQSFWTQFAQVNQIGGVANLAVLQFATTAEIVNAGQPILNEMKRLDKNWVTSLNNFIDPSIRKPPGYSTYDPSFIDCATPSCTNWDAGWIIILCSCLLFLALLFPQFCSWPRRLLGALAVLSIPQSVLRLFQTLLSGLPMERQRLIRVLVITIVMQTECVSTTPEYSVPSWEET